jgi:hypothetical protein
MWIGQDNGGREWDMTEVWVGQDRGGGWGNLEEDRVQGDAKI